MNRIDLAGACREAIQAHRMLTRGDRLVVGVSGGADSVALLHFLSAHAGEWGLQLAAAHLNHKLRGEESDRDQEHVRALCDRWGVPLTVGAADVAALAKARRLSVEECAREERYSFLERAAGDGKIATAHTLDDSAETLLLNLTRGTGLRGLCGVPPVRGRIIRPLISCTRAQVEAYLREHALPYVTDSTNLTDAYTRNRLRRHVMPTLREINPSLPRTLAGTMEALRADADLLDRLAREALDLARLGPDRCSARRLEALPQALRMRAILLLLAERGIPVEQRRLLQVDALLREGGQAQLSGQWLCRLEGDDLAFLPARKLEPDALPPITISPPYDKRIFRVLSGKTLQIQELGPDKYKETMNYRENQFQNALDCDKMDWIVQLRGRLPGDNIRLAGRGCTKTLKKLYNEAGLTPTQRHRTLVLAGSGGPLWVEGFGAAEHAAAHAGSRRILSLEVWEQTAEPTDSPNKAHSP